MSILFYTQISPYAGIIATRYLGVYLVRAFTGVTVRAWLGTPAQKNPPLLPARDLSIIVSDMPDRFRFP